MTSAGAYVALPEGSAVVAADGPGPFITRVRYRLADGSLREWSSRAHRKHGGGSRPVWIAVLFMAGSACFAVGSVAGYSSLVGARADAVTYFAGSLIFTSAAYLQYVECISAPTDVAAAWHTRIFALEIRRIDWWASVVQLAGTLFFNLTTFFALDSALSAKGADLVVWTPDAFGSICFLIASQLAYAEAGHRWISWHPRDAGWRIAALNMLGSILFAISAVAGWIVPSSGDLLDAALDTSGTFWGAICFLIGAALLLADRPGTEPSSA